jgi:DNA-3-methyladenine glycosylase I
LSDRKKRCAWAETHPLNLPYHDREWGKPLHQDRRLFEMLILEGAQAGLSWITILKKRERYREVFAGFDPQKVARFDKRKVARLLEDEGIIRNRLKIAASIKNARAFLAIQKEFGSFDRFIWDFVDGKPIVGRFKTMAEVPVSTDVSVAMSKELKRRGMTFVGPTIMYAYMQATGLVNDHLTSCFRYRELRGAR